jgi:hypothetical protein
LLGALKESGKQQGNDANSKEQESDENEQGGEQIGKATLPESSLEWSKSGCQNDRNQELEQNRAECNNQPNKNYRHRRQYHEAPRGAPGVLG